MKKLNKKGFTLIELLAVIVILAIIVVVTVPTILNSIKDARLSSFHSLSKEVANWYDTSVAQDQLALTGEKILGTLAHIDSTVDYTDGEWYCLADIENEDNKNLAQLYGLSDNDVVIVAETVPSFNSQGCAEGPYGDDIECSVIRINNGRAEIVLMAKENGKFDTNGRQGTYAPSYASNAGDDMCPYN